MEKEELEKLAEDTFPQILKNPLKQEREHIEAQRHGFIKGYQKAQQEAKIIEGMKMDENQELNGWKSNEGFDIGAA